MYVRMYLCILVCTRVSSIEQYLCVCSQSYATESIVKIKHKHVWLSTYICYSKVKSYRYISIYVNILLYIYIFLCMYLCKHVTLFERKVTLGKKVST